MFNNNLGCMKNVIKFCIKNKTKLIHISSASVYGKHKNVVNERDNSLLKPQSPYAEIKLIEENLLKIAKNKIKFMSFRFGTIAGVSPGMRFHTAINKFCFEAALNQPIKVYKTAYNQFRPYLSIRDAFRVFKFCFNLIQLLQLCHYIGFGFATSQGFKSTNASSYCTFTNNFKNI